MDASVVRIGVIERAEAASGIHPNNMYPTTTIHVDRRIPPRVGLGRMVDRQSPPSPTAIRAHVDEQPPSGAVADHIDRSSVGG